MSFTRFLVFACVGIMAETLCTGTQSLLVGDWNLTTRSYLYMIPVYGFGGLGMARLSTYLENRRVRGWTRSLIFLLFIYLTELTAGYLLLATIGRIPWNYGQRWYILGHGAVNLLYAPLWMTLTIVFDIVNDWTTACSRNN